MSSNLVGKLDWKLISSVSLEAIIQETNISELQSILDPITFCDISPNDIKNNTVESISKLTSLMQLIAEYLLHCQEIQYRTMRDLNSKQSKLKTQFDKYKKENISLREDVKIYQRQLALLRQSISKTGGGTINNNKINPYETEVHYVSPKIVIPAESTVESYRNKLDNKVGLDSNIVESILNHERETRSLMTSILDEQREMFLKQMSLLTDSMKDLTQVKQKKESIDNSILADANVYIDKFKDEFKSLIKSAIGSIPMNNTQTSQLSGSNDISSILKSAALETYEKELKRKEYELLEREKILKIHENFSKDVDYETDSRLLQQQSIKNRNIRQNESSNNKQTIKLAINLLNTKYLQCK